MKRDRKRLTFNKESIRDLTPSHLAQVAGGLIKTAVGSVCSYTDQQCGTSAAGSIGWCTSQNCPPETAGCHDSWAC